MSGPFPILLLVFSVLECNVLIDGSCIFLNSRDLTYGFSFRKKFLLTVLCIIVYRFLLMIPLPFVDLEYVQSLFGSNSSLMFLNVVTGGSLSSVSIVALGITPYISASILVQMLSVVIPVIAKYHKMGYTGEKKIKRLTDVLSIVLGVIEAIGIVFGFRSAGLLIDTNWYALFVDIIVLIAGMLFVVFMSNYISDHLFGNGVSIILTVGILSNFVAGVRSLFMDLTVNASLSTKIFVVFAIAFGLFVLFSFTTWLHLCVNRIHVVYSGRVSMSGQSVNDHSVIPIRLVGSGVLPVIFATWVLTFPSLLTTLTGKEFPWMVIFDTSCWFSANEWWLSFGAILYCLLIIGFAYYYQNLTFNCTEIADTLKRNGGVVSGVRPGLPTTVFLHDQVKYITLLGSICLCIISLVPIVVSRVFSVGHVGFMGTSVIIVVSTVLDCLTEYKASVKVDRYARSKSFFGMESLFLLSKNNGI